MRKTTPTERKTKMAQLHIPSTLAFDRTGTVRADGAGIADRPAAGAEAAVEQSSLLRLLYQASAFTAVFVVLCCGVYPVLVWGFAQAVLPIQANGSLVTKDGAFTTDAERAVGSALLGQNFALPQYFHPRPSAAGSGYDATSSGGTNLGPISDKLLNGIHDAKNEDGSPNPSADFDGVKDLVAAYRSENGLAENAIVPADAVTRSASGLDPHISPENARLQAARVATARGVSLAIVQKVIDQHTDAPSLGILGDPGVNVLMVNLALDRLPVAGS
jgi:K+-transporting ATPase ATPase C chain